MRLNRPRLSRPISIFIAFAVMLFLLLIIVYA